MWTNDSVCQTPFARVVGWPKRKSTQEEVQRAMRWFYTLSLTGFGTLGKLCRTASAVPFHAFEIISTHLLALTFEISMLLNKETHTHTSPARASGLYVL